MTHEQLTAAEIEDKKLTSILYREQEISDYQANIDGYAEQLKTLPTGEWPAEIVQYQKWGHDTQKLAANVPAALVEQVSDYAFRDHVVFLKTTETLEQKRSNLVYDGSVAAVKNDGGLDDAALGVKLAAKKVVLDADAAARLAKELA